jgi:tetratricopeptide (TPR) repeat protein
MRHVLIGLALVLAAMPASAQTMDKNMVKCGSENVKTSISGCTAVLQAKPAMSAEWRIVAYIYRGQSYQKKGHEELAFADFNDALALNPDAEALTGLHAAIGLYYYNKPLFAECISSASKVIALKPDMAMGLQAAWQCLRADRRARQGNCRLPYGPENRSGLRESEGSLEPPRCHALAAEQAASRSSGGTGPRRRANSVTGRSRS